MPDMLQTHEMLAGEFTRPVPGEYNSTVPNYDSEDEWEYEYDETETETYYVTLDLSIPEFTTRDNKNIHQAGRGGYLASWISEPPADTQGSSSQYRFAAEDLSGSDSEAIDSGSDRDEGDETGGKREKSIKGKGKAVEGGEEEGKEDEEEQELQVLELHSDKPIVAYRGRIFECAWAENTGTELLFSKASDLPCVSKLSSNVDLLAASSTRLLATERKIQPRTATNLQAIKEEHGIRVAFGRDLNGERKKQAGFLENFMALKKLKGETDKVPVVARAPANKTFRDDRDPGWKPRKRKIRGKLEGDLAGVVGVEVTSMTPSGAGEEDSTGKTKDILFQSPWNPAGNNGPVPFFSTPQFRPRRKRQEILTEEEEAEKRRRRTDKVDLPVEKSARVALISEDHGVSVSSGPARRGEKVTKAGENSDAEMEDV